MFKTVIEEENVSRFPDLIEYPEITDEETLRDLIGDLIIISHYTTETIDDLFERLIDIGVRCWGFPNEKDPGTKLQQILIKIKQSDDSPETYAIQFNRFILSLAYIKPIIPYLSEVCLKDFMLETYHTDKQSFKFQERIVGVLRSHCVPISDIQEIMSDVMMSLKVIMKTFSHADMEILTAENIFLDHYRESEIIREINNTHYPASMQTSEIIEENARRYEILAEEMFKRHNPFFENNFYTKILKPKQIEESMINFSQTPDGKRLVPVIQNGNGFYAGYKDIPVLYAGAIAARVPDIMNDDQMGDAGYFSRNLMILTYGTISKTVWNCGSRNKLPVVMDEVELEMREGRYYSLHKDDEVLFVLKKTDKQFIGQTLWFRSPCTCNLNEDVCHVCYGNVALSIGDLPGGFIYTTEIATSRISQNILSAKHILKANAVKVEFSSNFEKYFEFESSMIFPLDDKPFDIFIPENFQDDISEKLVVYVKKGKGLEPITVTKYSSVYIPDELLEKCKEVEIDDVTYLKISSTKVLDTTERLCNVTPINIMMTQKYANIKRLIENELPKMNSMEEAVSKLNHYTHGIIPLLAVHNEVIIGRHLRRPDNKLLRPNWLNPDEPYEILRLRSALEYIESIATAYSFEKPYEQTHKKIFDERNKINRVGARSFSDFMYGQTKNY